MACEIFRLTLAEEGGKIRGRAAGSTGCGVRFVNCLLRDVKGAEVQTEDHDTVLILKKDAEFSASVQE